MTEKRYRIAHLDGRAYDVSKAAFDKLYRPEGFTITANADGSALEPPRATKPRSSRSRSAAARKGAKTRRARSAAAEIGSALALDSASPSPIDDAVGHGLEEDEEA